MMHTCPRCDLSAASGWELLQSAYMMLYSAFSMYTYTRCTAYQCVYHACAQHISNDRVWRSMVSWLRKVAPSASAWSADRGINATWLVPSMPSGTLAFSLQAQTQLHQGKYIFTYFSMLQGFEDCQTLIKDKYYWQHPIPRLHFSNSSAKRDW